MDEEDLREKINSDLWQMVIGYGAAVPLIIWAVKNIEKDFFATLLLGFLGAGFVGFGFTNMLQFNYDYEDLKKLLEQNENISRKLKR